MGVKPVAMVKGCLLLAWVAALVAGFSQVSERLQRSNVGREQKLTAPPLSRLSTAMLNVVTAGHRGLYDDFAEVWLLQTLGDKQVRKLDPDLLAKTVRTVTRHGPKVESLYLLSCFVLSLEMARPGECLPISIDGIKALPLSWRIPMTQGYVASFMLEDPGTGALYYELASSRPKAPAYLASLAQKLAARVQMTDTERADAKLEMFKALGIEVDNVDKLRPAAGDSSPSLPTLIPEDSTHAN